MEKTKTTFKKKICFNPKQKFNEVYIWFMIDNKKFLK